MAKNIKINKHPEESRTVRDILGDVWGGHRHLDALASIKLRGHEVSCQKGCSDCCMLITMVGIGEGLKIAARLLHKNIWSDLLPGISQQARNMDYEGVSTVSYFERREPCVFLKDNLCSIYEDRPSACRLHFAFTPKEACSPDAPKNVKKASPDFRELEYRMARQEVRYAARLKVETNEFGHCAAPLPLVVIEGLKILTRVKRRSTYAVIARETEGIPTPGEWLRKHHEGFDDAQPVKVVRATQDEIALVRMGVDVHRVSGAAPDLEQDLLPGDTPHAEGEEVR